MRTDILPKKSLEFFLRSSTTAVAITSVNSIDKPLHSSLATRLPNSFSSSADSTIASTVSTSLESSGELLTSSFISAAPNDDILRVDNVCGCLYVDRLRTVRKAGEHGLKPRVLAQAAAAIRSFIIS